MGGASNEWDKSLAGSQHAPPNIDHFNRSRDDLFMERACSKNRALDAEPLQSEEGQFYTAL